MVVNFNSHFVVYQTAQALIVQNASTSARENQISLENSQVLTMFIKAGMTL